MFTLGDIARKGARLHGQREAIVFEGTRVTYRAFDERVNRLANALLAAGVDSGQTIGVFAENTHKYLEAYLAASKAGLVVTPLNFRLADAELAHIINDAEMRLLLVGDTYLDVARRIRADVPAVHTYIAFDGQPEDMLDYETALAGASAVDPHADLDESALAVLMYTGGTTGLPKGVMLSHRNLVSGLLCLTQQYQFTMHDTTCMMLPLFHVSFWPAFCHLMVGGKVVVVRRPELIPILAAVQDERCTHLNAVPTLYNWLLEFPQLDDYDLSSLRLMTYAGSPIPERVLQTCMQKYGRIFAQGYGLTEAAPVVTALMPEDHILEGPGSQRLRSVGREGVIVQIKIADDEGRELPIGEVGEVAVRGPNITQGYWKNPELTAQKIRDGWLYTGDVGSVDDEGYLYLVDRKADMIITGGENVYPAETEAVLYRHPAVYECVVVSAPDEKWGERVQAVVVLKESASATEDELIAHCKASLAGYKCPKQVAFWDQIPKSTVGKILRREVKVTFWEGRDKVIG